MELSSEAGYKARPKELSWEKQEMATVKRKESRLNPRRDNDKSGPWGLAASGPLLQQGPATKDVSNSIPIHTSCTESDSFHLSQLRFTYLDTL